MYVALITDYRGIQQKHNINKSTFEDAHKEAKGIIKKLNGAKKDYELILYPKVQEITETGMQYLPQEKPKKGGRK